MGIITKLFGRGSGSPPPRNVAELVAPLTLPAAQLVKSPTETRSYFGGAPALPRGVAWPANGGKPLAFLACVDLESLAETAAVPWLPSSGRLSFFYDVENQPWGFDPKDRGGWAVMLADHEQLPASPPLAHGLRRRSIAFQRISTYPSWERPEVSALGLTDAEAESLADLGGSAYGDLPRHQMGGFPSPVQGDEMELECQLVSNGLYCGDASGYQSPDAAPLRSGAKDWRLLLQIDSDDDFGVMWGDVGVLYFWIKESDARARRFENCWVVLQCH
jgi:Domain of unknown function (DUF1963)